jgi:dTDP-4-amino-4,6-dideoxygalactose transaminase
LAIPFNKPYMTGKELANIAEAMRLGHVAGDGAFTRKCQRWLEDFTGAGMALLTTSCTDALEMAAILIDIKDGDEVIVPSYTFVSTINAFVLRGAKPVFADIRPDTLNLDESALDRLITPRTRAIVPVHYAGVSCEMDAITSIAAGHRIAVIEDNAHGLFGRYKGRSLGSFGAMATQSFHETKNIVCGEGGALLINDAGFAHRAEIIRDKGTNRRRFFRGLVDKYTWVDIGSSFLMSDILAAFLYAQFEAQCEIQARRRRLWESYDAGLEDWVADNGVSQPTVPPHCQQAYHMYYLLLPSNKDRNGLIDHLKRADVSAVFHYLPLHISDMGVRFGGRAGDCPVSEDVSDRILRLPFYNSMSDAEQEFVLDHVKQFRCTERHRRTLGTGNLPGTVAA